MARGNDGRKVFLKDSDYGAFLDGLAVTRKRYPFYLYAYVLMSNHFHLLLEKGSEKGSSPLLALDRSSQIY